MGYRLFLFFAFLLMSSSLFSAWVVSPFTKPFEQPPLVYQGNYFGVVGGHVVSAGHGKQVMDWNSVGKVRPDSPLFAHFNRILFINEASHLVSLDYRFGEKQWEVSDDVATFVLSYPQLVYVTKKGSVVAVDFMSGNSIWRKEFPKGVDGLSMVGQSGLLGVVTEGQLMLLTAFNGGEVSKVVLPKKLTKIVSSWNKGLVFDSGSDFYTFLLEKKSVVKSDVLPTQNAQWLDERYYLTYDPLKHRLKTQEIESGQVVWLESDVPTGSRVFYAPPYVMATTPSKNLLLYQVNRSGHKRLGDLKETETFNPHDVFYVNGSVIYMVSATRSMLLELGEKKQSRWTPFSWTNN